MSVFDLCWINLGISIYSLNEIDFNVKVGGCSLYIFTGNHFTSE